MERLTIEVFYSDEDRGFIAKVKEIEGISAYGDTIPDAVKELSTALDLYFNVAREMKDE